MGCDLSPLQVLAEFPELPYVRFGQGSPSMSAGIRDVGEERASRQMLSIAQKHLIVQSYENSGMHIDDFMKDQHLVRPQSRGGDGNRRNLPRRRKEMKSANRLN